ncbi:hypothetical protein DL93DRAFT_2075315 [Clavulina sp. PMI_390]|nr:hypothetical protein DL93DRAFT_2075315 [Clavulina sp. PMI_390]
MGDPHSSASRVVSGLLSLRQLGFGLKMRHYEGSNEIEEELRCLQELPTRICHVVLHADGRTWERDNSR